MMEKLNLYKIKEMALKIKRAVYSTQQLSNLINKSKPITNVYASRLVEKGLAKKILRGKISFKDDEYVIASQLFEPSYISLSSALFFHGLVKQIPRYIQCVSPKNSRKYLEHGIIYHKIPSSLFFGYEKYEKSGSYIFVADPEKAIIDAIYLNAISKSTIDALWNKLNKSKLKKYLKRHMGRGKKKMKEILYDR
jgi:predicted transcriptional regulator of viral defense system